VLLDSANRLLAGVAVRNIPAAQVNIPGAGQLGQAPPGGVPAAGPDVPVQPGHDPTLPQMVCYSSSLNNDPAHRQRV